MNSLRKKLLTAAVVAGLGLTAVAFASPWGGYGPMGGGMGDCPMMGDGPGKGLGRMGRNSEQHMAMMQQFHAERMELLAARLKLKPEQESAWKAFIAAQDAHHLDRMKMRQEMRADKETTAQAHFEERIQGMERHLASMKSMAKATGDLYAVLDAEQKQAMDKFFTDRPRRGMMRGQADETAPPAPPAQ